MRTRFFQLPGVSFVAIGLQTSQARGIEVDNSSGSWLYIPSLETFVPPFTIGWSYDFPYAVSGVDIHAAIESPAGQISTLQGDGVTVYLTDGAVGTSGGVDDVAGRARAGAASSPGTGVPFIEGFTPVLGAEQGNTATLAFVDNLAFVAAIPGKRFRILTGSAMYIHGVTNGVSPVHVSLHDGSDSVQVDLRVTPDHPTDTQLYPLGLDFPVSQSIVYSLWSLFAFEEINVNMTYQVI